MCYAAIIAASISRFVQILVPPHFGRQCDYLIFGTLNFLKYWSSESYTGFFIVILPSEQSCIMKGNEQ